MIRIQRLHKSFNGLEVLRGVDLEIPSGSIAVILGRSGSGKSVLMRNIIGLTRPDSGKVIVDGTNLTALGAPELNRFRRKFGMLFQSAALFDSLTVADNIAFPLREHTDKSEDEIQQTVNELLSTIELRGANDKYPSELSGGMRKRVGLARAIALEPEIILYDEPTTGLDPLTSESINELIVTMQRKFQVTSVIISHDIESTFRVADQVAMLHEGRIIEHASPQEFKKSRHEIVQQFIGQSQGVVGP